MKIAFIATQRESTWAGGEELWWETARLALERGHQVAVAASLAGGAAQNP